MTSWAIRDIAKLDEEEKILIRKSWNELMQDVENNALEIFKMIFEQAPETKEVSTPEHNCWRWSRSENIQ